MNLAVLRDERADLRQQRRQPRRRVDVLESASGVLRHGQTNLGLGGAARRLRLPGQQHDVHRRGTLLEPLHHALHVGRQDIPIA